jgi:hypothetical protein
VQHEFDTPAWQRRLNDLAGMTYQVVYKNHQYVSKKGVNHIENVQFFIL